MALTTTTLSSAVAVTDNAIVVSSATGFAAGYSIIVDQELMQVAKSYVSGTTIPVLRGQDGTVTAAHKASANVTVGLASDFANPVANTVSVYSTVKGRTVTSYSAAGAIALPTPGSDAVAVLNGTSALAMTLANPTKDMDGSLLWIAGNGKAAHTVTYTAGFGNGGSSYDVFTFATGANNGIALLAVNGIWNMQQSLIGGTATAITATIA